ncbi:MAG: helix-turn-helix domain-containing protein [Frisingicoccus sp.]|uniref:helix-turn-helix domain-containing protein n=1 Tax=Frisingicoccus sp. TaxID=1918627 RepID=UPI002A7F0D60|nr:helix-turn-helix domain-containing protein [Frisingicoccus sp.]MDY4835455.1 helix-turn-helix domain-containing protein [Frisingicoccus sp.]
MEMGEKIYNLRKAKGLTLEELGNLVGVGKSTVRKWEKGMIANMKRDKISKLASALNVSPAYLMGWEMDDGDIGNALVADCLEKEIDNMASLAPSEKDHFKAYINLLEINRKKVDDYTNQLLSIQQMEHDAVLAAACQRTDIEVTEQMRTHDDDIMNDDSEWK